MLPHSGAGCCICSCFQLSRTWLARACQFSLDLGKTELIVSWKLWAKTSFSAEVFLVNTECSLRDAECVQASSSSSEHEGVSVGAVLTCLLRQSPKWPAFWNIHHWDLGPAKGLEVSDILSTSPGTWVNLSSRPYFPSSFLKRKRKDGLIPWWCSSVIPWHCVWDLQ